MQTLMLLAYRDPMLFMFLASTWFGFLCVTAGLLMDKGYPT